MVAHSSAAPRPDTAGRTIGTSWGRVCSTCRTTDGKTNQGECPTCNGSNMAKGSGASPSRQRPGGGVCEPGNYGAPFPYLHNGSVYGADPVKAVKGCDTLAEVAKFLCWTGTTFVSDAVAGGATVAFSIEVKWWWQSQEFTWVGDQVTRAFELTNIRYGQSTYTMDIKELQINGAVVAQQGIDVRLWNIEVYQRFYPVPASALNDPVELEFTNENVGAQDFQLVAMGPAVLQIG